MTSRSRAVWLGLVSASLLAAVAHGETGARPVVKLRGADFVGGAARVFGSNQQGAVRTNYLYAVPTGALSVMAADFALAAVPTGPLLLHVRAMLDDWDTPCPIRITLNETQLFAGPNGFAHREWEWKRFPIPTEALRAGSNRLEFRNTSAEGQSGMPPWFMLAICAIGPEDCDIAALPDITEDFRVTLAREVRPLPEPLSGGHTEPGFRFRGIKGWLWRPEQYLAEIPVLARYRMNFLMNCYGSMMDIEHYGFGAPQCNRWWEPLPQEKKAKYEQVVRACQQQGLSFCFSLNPNLGSTRIVRYDSREDYEALWQHYAWMQRLGVHWFNLQFDDISAGIDAAGQARLGTKLLTRLRRRDPQAQFIICPTYYWGDGSSGREYLQTLARELHPDIYVIWTGPGVVTGRITREAAESYRKTVGHRLIIWDNYPVNDGAPTLHLGPVTGRDRDLCEVADGFMANPMHSENEIGRIPLLTMADYAYNPWDYDPARSIGQAIVHLARTPAQRETLRDLVEMYPGMLMYNQGTGYNPLLVRFQEQTEKPHSRWLAALMIGHVEEVLGRLQAQFPGQFADARQTVGGNLKTMRAIYDGSYVSGR
jgi:hypothetical protein